MMYQEFRDISLSRLGMGNMRLPMRDGAIDEEKAQEIIDYAMAHGINYYDTAWVYNDGGSERFLGPALRKYPRDSYYLATKFNIHATPDPGPVFEEQLRRLCTEHIDFYLLHCLTDGNINTYLESGCIDYFLEQQKKGRIRYLGFSSHASPKTLERFASHHAWDFAQLQINYFDWKYNSAKAEYEILEKKGIPIMVMEPVRGGRLASLTAETEGLLKAAHPDWTVASWALRFVQSLPRVQVILSGMSNLEQIRDNVATFSGEVGLSDGDLALLLEVCEKFRSQVQIPCTACRYCTSGCPVQINIPEFLKVYNSYKVNGRGALRGLQKVESEGSPADCIGCGACTGHCPQNIDVPKLMQELAAVAGK